MSIDDIIKKSQEFGVTEIQDEHEIQVEILKVLNKVNQVYEGTEYEGRVWTLGLDIMNYLKQYNSNKVRIHLERLKDAQKIEHCLVGTNVAYKVPVS